MFDCIECERLTGWYHVYHAAARAGLKEYDISAAKASDEMATQTRDELEEHKRSAGHPIQERML